MNGSSRPPVSIVIPHLNQHEALARCLASIAAQDYPAELMEVIVVDNGSTLPVDHVLSPFPFASAIAEPEPGPGPARNAGVAAASHGILAFIDADCRAGPGWLSAAVAALSLPESTGVVGGDVRIDMADPRRLTAIEAYEAVFAFRQKMYITQHGFSGTGNLAMQAAVYREIGPFKGIDTAEDRDWGQRAGRAGHAAIYVPKMVVFHPARASFDELCEKWRRHISHDLFVFRASGRSSLVWMIRVFAVIASTAPHAVFLMASDRLSGGANRARGLLTLARVRLFRAVEMVLQFRHADSKAATGWNRQG